MVGGRCFIIAEAGVNHNGSEALALRLVEEAAACGADAIKFQTFSADSLAVPGASTADYQRTNTGETDQLTMLRGLELPPKTFRGLKARADKLGIEFMSTPFDARAARFLVELGVRRIKVASGEITNLPFLRDLAAYDLPLLVSTGMSDMEEVVDAVATIADARARAGHEAPLAERLTLLHCTSNYPARPEDVNLRAMSALRERFSLPIGYSDHTDGTFFAVAAVALGATVLEKHFTIDRALPGPDHKASLAPNDLCRMIAEVRATEAGLGDGAKTARRAELPVRQLVRRSVTLVAARQKGERIGAEQLALLRPGTGISPKDILKVVGRRAARDLAAGSTLTWEDVAE